jgi:transposase
VARCKVALNEEEIMDALSQPISQPRIKRCYRSAEERRRIVEETLVPGTSVAKVARAHGVNANQVFGWRKLYQAGLLRR